MNEQINALTAQVVLLNQSVERLHSEATISGQEKGPEQARRGGETDNPPHNKQ